MIRETIDETKKENKMSIPKQPNGQFLAKVEGKTDYSVRSVDGQMAIMAYDEIIYITKAQAKAFWGLHEEAPKLTITDYSKCRNVLEKLELAYPRSCQTCGLGPCKTGSVGSWQPSLKTPLLD